MQGNSSHLNHKKPYDRNDMVIFFEMLMPSLQNFGRHKANPSGISGYLNVGRGKAFTSDQFGEG